MNSKGHLRMNPSTVASANLSEPVEGTDEIIILLENELFATLGKII